MASTRNENFGDLAYGICLAGTFLILQTSPSLREISILEQMRDTSISKKLAA